MGLLESPLLPFIRPNLFFCWRRCINYGESSLGNNGHQIEIKEDPIMETITQVRIAVTG